MRIQGSAELAIRLPLIKGQKGKNYSECQLGLNPRNLSHSTGPRPKQGQKKARFAFVLKGERRASLV